jgi:hypothetical protein
LGHRTKDRALTGGLNQDGDVGDILKEVRARSSQIREAFRTDATSNTSAVAASDPTPTWI